VSKVQAIQAGFWNSYSPDGLSKRIDTVHNFIDSNEKCTYKEKKIIRKRKERNGRGIR
jgi:hypothetical protein